MLTVRSRRRGTRIHIVERLVHGPSGDYPLTLCGLDMRRPLMGGDVSRVDCTTCRPAFLHYLSTNPEEVPRPL